MQWMLRWAPISPWFWTWGWLGWSVCWLSLIGHYPGKLSSTTSAAHPGQSTARSGAPDQVPRFDTLTHHQGQFSCLVRVKSFALSPNCCRGMWGRGGQISCSHTLRTGSSGPPNNRSAPVCCPGLQSLLFCHAGTL